MYLHKRNSTYYFRVRIPYLLAQKISKNEIRHSLKIKDKIKAQKLAIFLSYKVDLLFKSLIKGLDMSNNIKEIIRNYINEAIVEYSELEDIRHESYTYFDEYGKQYKGHTQQAIEAGKNQLAEIINQYDFNEMEQKAIELISRYNLDLKAFENLTQKEKEINYAKLIKAEIEVLEYDKDRNLNRLNGFKSKEETKQDTNFLSALVNKIQEQGILEEDEQLFQVANNLKNKYTKKNLLSEKSQEFLEIEKAPRKWTNKTYNKVKLALNRAIEIMGDRDLSTYIREDFENFRTTLIYLPPNFKKLKEFKGKTTIEVSNINKQKEKQGKKVTKLSDSSVNDIIGWIHTFMEWAFYRGYLDRNYSKCLKVKKKKSNLEDKLPFSQEDIIQIKNTLLKKAYKNRNKKPAHYWLILIGFYQGMRLEEIAQLHIEDIYQVNDIWVFDINERPNKYGEEVKSVKNAPSIRVIPIHPKLIELGFIDYYLKTKQQGHERVWYMLKRDENGYGRNPARWFNDNIKIHISNHHRKTFHSTRHTFIQVCKDISIDSNKMKALVGHGSKDIDYTVYGKAFSPDILLEEVKKISYLALNNELII